jgi:acetolactate synthase-1/3 small subunit
MQHLISILVYNKPGVLSRIASLFSRRGYNIDSLAVGVSEDPTFSRMTIVVKGDEQVLEQIFKQLHKLIDVYKVIDLSSQEHVERELMLIRLNADKTNRSEIMQICDIFRARIVSVTEKALIIEMTGTGDKLVAFEDLIRKFGIQEIARTGKIALNRLAKK